MHIQVPYTIDHMHIYHANVYIYVYSICKCNNDTLSLSSVYIYICMYINIYIRIYIYTHTPSFEPVWSVIMDKTFFTGCLVCVFLLTLFFIWDPHTLFTKLQLFLCQRFALFVLLLSAKCRVIHHDSPIGRSLLCWHSYVSPLFAWIIYLAKL